jgi:hypothetical protein
MRLNNLKWSKFVMHRNIILVFLFSLIVSPLQSAQVGPILAVLQNQKKQRIITVKTAAKVTVGLVAVGGLVFGVLYLIRLIKKIMMMQFMQDLISAPFLLIGKAMQLPLSPLAVVQ